MEQDPPCRDQLQQQIDVVDICGRHGEAELLRLEEERAIPQRLPLGILPILSITRSSARE
jgi:hypothetical protein